MSGAINVGDAMHYAMELPTQFPPYTRQARRVVFDPPASSIMQNMTLPVNPVHDPAGGLRHPHKHGLRVTRFFPATVADPAHPRVLWTVDPAAPRTPTMVRSADVAPLAPAVHGLQPQVSIGDMTLPFIDVLANK